ncbi:MAG: hypothetical protein ISR82_01800 [Candidatus Marinimicrobia bacterium]|nr:hypothetical protein [Candidatus Neomarinimicrobiota bacterium]MBL7009939.1 hypothetical protein [Candidatus Neomarinimicrobiota bacterium]MBL7029762.1 hypothetical protein [Candidatus Neomarinimicrobiota bacterium]
MIKNYLNKMPNRKKGLRLAIINSFLLIWVSMGVGVIGADGEPLNIIYFGVVSIWIITGAIYKFQPKKMVKALTGTAIAQAIITIIAITMKWGYPYSPALELLGLNGFYIVLWLWSASFYRIASK